MTNIRDNFTESVKRELAKRVGYHCSKPDCNKLTVGPNDDPGKSTSIGVAAHISAASQGGPRFDSALSQSDRKSINNGIWLCNTHATLIDKNPKRYSVAKLFEWKALAEEKAQERLEGTGTFSVIYAFDQISEALAIMKIEKYKRKCNWGNDHSVQKLLDKLEQFSYINSLKLVEEVGEICISILEDEESKVIQDGSSISFCVYHCLTKFFRYGKIILPGTKYVPVIHDIIYGSVRYVRHQSNHNPDRVPSAQVLNIIKFIYQRLKRIEDQENQTFIVDQLVQLQNDIKEDNSPFQQLYVNLLHQYRRILPDFYMGILPFEDAE